MIIDASSTSRRSTVSRARSMAVTTMSIPSSAWRSSVASSSWKCVRVVSDTVLADLARDVGLRAGVGRVGEDPLGLVELHHAARAGLAAVQLDDEERGAVGDARRLLHVVRDDDDRVVLLELEHQVLDLPRRDRVEG